MARSTYLLVACVVLISMSSSLRSSDDEIALPKACQLFSEEVEFVEQILYMKQEKVRHRLRIPKIYFEDGWDRINGIEHEAQLISVSIDDFTPVTRADTAQLNKEGRITYMWFVMRDLIPLEERLPINLTYAYPGASRDLTSFLEVEAEYGLTEFRPVVATDPNREAFVARENDGALRAILVCSRIQDFPDGRPVCRHDVRINGIDVSISYPRAFMSEWTRIEESVSDFISCALH